MPHLVLDYEAAKRIRAQYGLVTTEQTAAFLGIDVALVRDTCVHRKYPSEEFIAAVLLRIPCRFDEIFRVVDGCLAA